MSYTFLDMAREVLKGASRPLTYREIWTEAVNTGLNKKVGTKGSTPWFSIGALISTDVRLNANSTFVSVGKHPQRYFLKSREDELPNKPAAIVMDDLPVVEKFSYQEKDLHPLLAYFAHSSPNFMGEQQVYTKTIVHQKTKNKKQKNALTQWLHPDMVGVYFPFDDFEKSVIELGKSLNSNSAQIFSFELKQSVNTSNYRECFFQTVSNSSWSHEGYLVAAEISQEDYLRSELGRLSNAFGIGIIHLNVADIDASQVLFPAKNKSELDWDTISKLCDNADFKAFIDRLNVDFGAGQVHDDKYDKVIDDPVAYIRNTLKVETAQ